MTTRKPASGYYEHQPNPWGLVSKVAQLVRRRMFAAVIRITGASAQTRILDVGVTTDRREESNFLEKLYPWPENITAVGLEDGSFLERECPGVRYIQADGLRLPFASKSFDLVTSFAVIEHVGSRENQRAFVHELCRVAKVSVIATPNRWFPVEVHTMMPFAHWLPPAAFRWILRRLGKMFYAEEKSLNLLDAQELKELFPPGIGLTEHHHRLFGLVSNLVVLATSSEG